MKALYRKYRPISLTEVIGQEAIVKSLKTAIKNHKISHAYLFVGPRGCGKTSVARIFAHEINRFPYKLEDSYTDIIEIDAASNRGIDNIRELREKAVIAPTTGQYKVYIVDEVHMLTREAFNALLKLLEEPPQHVVFIMATTDPEKVPVTITSRAQIFTFRLADPKTMQNHLQTISDQENIQITPDALSVIVRRGGGSFRDSISLLDQISTLKDGEITADDVTSALGLPQDEITSNLLSAYLSHSPTKITEIIKDFLNTGAKPETLVDELIKKILSAPTPELLPLLATLPEVQPPFSEAKLLVALLNTNHPSTRQPSQPPLTPPQSPSPTPQPSTPPPKASVPNPSANHSSPQPATPPTDNSSANDNSAPFDWQTFLSEIEPDNINLFKYLSASKPRISGSTIHIYASKKIEARILDAKNNKSILTSHAVGYNIEIHTPDELREIQQTDPQINQISDIMGNVQELKDDGNPF